MKPMLCALAGVTTSSFFCAWMVWASLSSPFLAEPCPLRHKVLCTLLSFVVCTALGMLAAWAMRDSINLLSPNVKDAS